MPRNARQESEFDIYHVTARGNGLQTIFLDQYDHRIFLEGLREVISEEFEVLAWCLMGNHFHLLVHGPISAVSIAMKALLGKYAVGFNLRYGRVGHLFQDRFYSEPVQSERHLLAAVRYIHQNPVKAGLSPTCDYPWSSYREYLGTSHDANLCNTAFILDMFDDIDDFARFHELDDDEFCFSDVQSGRTMLTDAAARSLIERKLGADILQRLPEMNNANRNEALLSMKRLGLTIRQIQRMTGLGFGIISRAK